MMKKIDRAENQGVSWGWPLVSLLFLLLGLSVYANRMLWQRAKEYYISVNATRLNPVGLKAFADSEIPAQSELTRVVFFGDSRAASWPTPVWEDQNLATENLAIESAEFFNRGLGSQTSVQTLQRFQADVAPLQPDVVVIQVGINDIKAIGLFSTQTSKILSEVVDNIEQLVAQAEATGAIVVLSSIFPTGEVTWARRFSLRSRPLWLSDAIDPAVIRVNQSLQALATDQDNDNIIWLDSYTLLVNEQGKVSRNYLEDELHLNERGYAELNQALIETLQNISLIKETQTTVGQS